MTTMTNEPLPDFAPCGLMRVAEDGRILAMNATLRALLGIPAGTADYTHIDPMLTPAARIFYQVSLVPTLRLAGVLDEIYLTLLDRRGGEIPVLINVRRRAEGASSDWAVVRIEQRGRWEAELLQAKRRAEESASKLERALAELKESNWLLRKAAEVLPTCMYCHRVKGDQAQWESAIKYLEKNEVFISHGCCPQCTPKLLADMGLKPDRTD